MVKWLNKLDGLDRPGFTLIEMLVVMAVIAILAGILIGVLPGVRNKSIRSTVKTEMKAVEMVINSYKEKHSVFPPDNPKDHARSPLYYELTGTTNVLSNPNDPNSVRSYHSLATHEVFTQQEVQALFGIDGFMNTGAAGDESAVVNFYKAKAPRTREIPAANNLPAYKVLVAPRYGADKQPAIWHYIKTNATNNHGEYDLWADIDMGGQAVSINNWEK